MHSNNGTSNGTFKQNALHEVRKHVKREALKLLGKLDFIADGSETIRAKLDGGAAKAGLLQQLHSITRHGRNPLQMDIARNNSSVSFHGEPTLIFLAEKGVKFPKSEEYHKRFELGKALITATLNSDANKVEELLSQNAYPNALDEHKDSALHMAVARNDLVIADLLLRVGGADPNIAGHDLTRPLHVLTQVVRCEEKTEEEAAHLPMLKLLLSHGADPLAQDANRQTALDYAKELQLSDFVKEMESQKPHMTALPNRIGNLTRRTKLTTTVGSPPSRG